MSDQPVAETSTYTTHEHKRQTGFDPATQTTKRPQTYALHRAATSISPTERLPNNNLE
jgi:hypothetical protein